MDYFDFYRFRKEVIFQNEYYRLICVRSTKAVVLIREYYSNIEGKYQEQARMHLYSDEIKALKELL